MRPEDYTKGYAVQLSQAVRTAVDFLKRVNYKDSISRQPQYDVKTVLPGVSGVQLTLEGAFEVAVPQGNMPWQGRKVTSLSPDQLVTHIVETAIKQGNVFPSYMMVGKPVEQQVASLLEVLVTEFKALPRVVELELKGRLSETKELLRLR